MFALRHGARAHDESLLQLSIATLDRIGAAGAFPDPPHAGDPGAGRERRGVDASHAARDLHAARNARAADDDDGAFPRACANADWTEPDRAHLLDVHADLIRLYLDAWTITGFERYRARAVAAWRWVDRVLHDRASDDLSLIHI